MIFRALARHMRKNNIVLGILCIILVFGIVKELQFLTVIALFVGLLIIYPKIKIDIPNIVREVIKEISIGKSRFIFREPLNETEIESEVLDSKPNADAIKIFNEANRFLSLGELSEAVKKYGEAIKIDDSFPHVHLNLGAAYLALWHQTSNEQHLRNSIKASKKALEIDKEGYRSRMNLAVAYSKIREKEPEALKLYEEADQRGDRRDPITWGKVKLFKAGLILTLSSRSGGKKYEIRLPKAEIALLESLRLFEIAGETPETSQWIKEATSLLDLIKKRLKALELAKAPRKGI